MGKTPVLTLAGMAAWFIGWCVVSIGRHLAGQIGPVRTVGVVTHLVGLTIVLGAMIFIGGLE